MASADTGGDAMVKTFKRGTDIQLSEHFHLSEFTCHCEKCTVVPVSMALVALLETIRADAVKLGAKGLKINCGFRCPSHNKAVGGVPDSQHVLGLAADIVAPGLDPIVMAAIAQSRNPKGGVGTYETFTHVDVRGRRARWRG